MAYIEQLLTHSVASEAIKATVGTWTTTNASGVISLNKSAADNTSVLMIPCTPNRLADFYGVKITGLKIIAEVSTADLDAAPTLVLYRQNMSAVDATASATSLVTATTIATTAGAGVVETADAQQRLWEFTVDSPAADYDTQALCDYNAVLTIDAGETSVVKIFGVIVNYTGLV